MGAEIHDLRDCEVSTAVAREELERLLDDPRFRVTARQRDILKYLAERRFDGYDGNVKAYAIALDVLGRPSGFDAANDPIVRIEISRLRSGLHAYYEAFGTDREISIHIPKGMYIALFPKNPPPLEPDDAGEDEVLAGDAGSDVNNAEGPPKEERVLTDSRPRWKPALAIAIGACLLVGGGLAVFPASPVLTIRPTVYVSMEGMDAGMRGEASVTRDMLLAAFTQFQTLTVAKATPGLADTAASSSRSYDLDIKYYGDGDDRSIWWQLVDKGSGNLLRAGVERFDISGSSHAAVREEITDRLARRLASGRGAINMVEMQAGNDSDIGNACVIRMEYALDEADPDITRKFQHCLGKTLAAAPDDPDALALMSQGLLATDMPDPTATAKALETAKRAVSLAPLSDRAQIALMNAQFADGRSEAAIQTGNRAIALNPHNPETAANLAIILYSAGYREAGVAMAQDAGRSVDTVPRNAMLVLALEAYRTGDYSEASLLVEQVSSGDFLTGAIRAAALGQLGSEGAGSRLAEIATGVPDFGRTFEQRMAQARLDPQLATDIKLGLVKAGADFKVAAAGPRS